MSVKKASLSSRAPQTESCTVAEFVIDKGVPIPQAPRGRRPKYPFAQLEVGDSFFVAGESRKIVTNLSRLAHSHKTRHGGDFVTRVVDGGARVWRVAPSNATGAAEAA